MKRRRESGTKVESDVLDCYVSQNHKHRRAKSNFFRQDHTIKQIWRLSLTLLVLAHVLIPCHCFFFPKSLFRRLSSSHLSPAAPPSPNSQYEPLIGSEQQIHPAIRIANRPNAYQSSSSPQQQQQQNQNFHVPKALCIACEKFPWMPVSGPDKPSAGEQAQPSQQQAQHTQLDLSQRQQVKTIVINALGEAKGPVPVPPQQANRKPFAIQFDSAKSTNDISVHPRPSASNLQGNENKNLDPATRPISFQIYDPPRQPTLLKPVGNSQAPNQQQNQRYPQEPSPFMQPPPNFQFQGPQMYQKQNVFFPDRVPSMTYGRPTVLQPIGNNHPPPSGNHIYSPSQVNNVHPPFPQFSQNQQNNGNKPPIPPITISTIVAAQHERANAGKAPEFQIIQPANLVYQEHTQIHGPSIAPYRNHGQTLYGPPNNTAPQPPQNIKMPILPRPFVNYSFAGQNQRPRGQYGPPPSNGHQISPPGGYLPPQPQQRPLHNSNIINLRAPPQQQPGGRYFHQQVQNPHGQVFFPRPQASIQYGPPPSPPNQGFNQPAGSQYSSITIPGVLQLRPGGPNSNDGNYRPQTDPHSSAKAPVSNLSPAEQSNDYHQSGSTIQNQHQNPSDNFVHSVPKLAFSPPKGVVKNPHIQSIETLKPPEPNKKSNQPTAIPITQENGWEIIPALQTDITHLFNNPPPTQSMDQPREVTVPVPLPVPIPIPESQVSKSPIFIIQNNPNHLHLDPQQPGNNGKIVVQGVTYHEEIRNPLDGRVPSVSQTQAAFVTSPPSVTIPYSTQPRSERPQLAMSPPIVQPQIILRPQPGHQFDPLPASISTALYHAQRTSYLTHQYLSQTGGENGQKTMYVHSVPVHQPEQHRVEASNFQNLNALAPPDSTHVSGDESSGKSSSVQNLNNAGHQVSVNCQTDQQWVTPEQKAEVGQSLSAATNTNSDSRPENPGNEEKPYLLYYPSPVQQSQIYWVQPPQSSQGVLQLRPQLQAPTEDESKQSANSVAFSPPVREWSTELVTPSVGDSRKPDAQSDDPTENGKYPGESHEDDREVDEYSFRIPYGQRLPVRTTITPFDIISVGENTSPVDESQAQSLEHEEDFPKSAQEHNARAPGVSSDYQESQREKEPSKTEGQNHLNDFSSASQDFDQGLGNGAVLKPISTTVIHSPESTSYGTQSFRFPSFKPQKVIFHDFTNGGGLTTLLQEQQEQQQEDRAIGQQSQNVQSWRAFYQQKAPKLVESYPEESEEGKQSIASGSSKVAHYQSTGEIASGPVTTAECGTTDTLTVTSTEDNRQTFSPLSSAEVVTKNGDREKIRFRLGARFPAGRPSVTSFNSWTATTTTTAQPAENGMSSSDDSDGKNPGSYSASISIPVYRPLNVAREIHNYAPVHGSTNSFSPPNNLLNLDDIYKKSEMKQHISLESTRSPLQEDHTHSETTEEGLTTMSTEKSSSFSISVDERMVEGNEDSKNNFDTNTARKVPHSIKNGQKMQVSVSHSQDSLQDLPEQSVHIVTSVPAVLSEYDLDAPSTTTTPSSSNTSTKIVKTVRVRQRMRPGGGNLNGTIRNRFNGPGRIRVVQRPVTPDYIKHFPEFATQESDKLAKEEEEEVKNALIELKRSERANA